MICLKNSAFVHLPRTGGTFVRTMVEDHVTAFSDHSVDLAMRKEARYSGKVIFGFIRHPSTWYESWLSIAFNGTELVHPAKLDPTLISLGHNKSVDYIIEKLCNPTQLIKDNAYKVALEGQGGRLQNVMLKLLKRWRETDNVTFYENMCDCFLSECDYVGKYENLKEELIFMLDSTKELTDQIEQKIINADRLNYGIRNSNSELLINTIDMINHYESRLIHKYYTA